MAVDIRDIAEGIGVLITGTGDVTDDEYRDAMIEHLTQSPEKFSRYRFSLSDYTAAERVDVAAETIREMAKLGLRAANSNPHPLVAVVGGRGLTYGLARMWEMLSDESPWEIKAFRSREAAEEWLRRRSREKFGLDIAGLD